MPTHDEYVAQLAQAWDDFGASTSALGGRVQGLIDQINATPGAGLTGPETEAVLANLATFKTTLDAMGVTSTPPSVPTPPIV